MVTEIEYTRELNRKGLALVTRKAAPVFVLFSLGFLYAKHVEEHQKLRANLFYNKSKLFGGAKTPAY